MTVIEFVVSVEDGKPIIRREGGPPERIHAIALIRHQIGDRIAHGPGGKAAVITAGMEPPAEATEIVYPRGHILKVDVAPEGRRFHLLEVRHAQVRGVFTALAPAHEATLPIRALTVEEQERCLPIPIDVGGKVKGPCIDCYPEGRSTPAIDTCSYCERPICWAHDILAWVDERVPMAMGYCSTCAWVLLDPIEEVEV